MKNSSINLFAAFVLILICFCAGANIRSKSEFDKSGHCVPGRTWMIDCNRCWCTENGLAACALKTCLHITEKYVSKIFKGDNQPTQGIISSHIRVKRSDNEIDSTGHCVPGRTWMYDCNRCWCGESGIPACTLKACIHIVENAAVLEQEDLKKMEESGAKILTKRSNKFTILDGQCEPGTTWESDCNSCFCTDEGVAACSGCKQRILDRNST